MKSYLILLSALYDDMVELVVSDKRVFVHRGLLCHLSSSFAKRLARPSEPRQVTTVALEDDTRFEVIEIFRTWLYTHQLCVAENLSVALLCDVYLFGKSWHIPLLENAAIDALIDKCCEEDACPDLRTAAHVYNNTSTTSGSALRRLLVDLTVASKSLRSLSDSNDQEVLADAAPFLLDVAITAKQFAFTAPRSLQIESKKCTYHDHSMSEERQFRPLSISS